MIQLKKAATPPASLSTTGHYNGQDVQEQLMLDQHGKCYLCEDKVRQHYQIEHFQSQANAPELTTDWNNLFLSCGYCNQKKSHRFPTLLNPLTIPVEEALDIQTDWYRKRVHIEVRQNIPGAESTRELLHRIHNGAGGMRTFREQMFYREFENELSCFLSALELYQHNPSPSTRAEVAKLLHISQPFLAAKLGELRAVPDLYAEFKDDVHWNRGSKS